MAITDFLGSLFGGGNGRSLMSGDEAERRENFVNSVVLGLLRSSLERQRQEEQQRFTRETGRQEQEREFAEKERIRQAKLKEDQAKLRREAEAGESASLYTTGFQISPAVAGGMPGGAVSPSGQEAFLAARNLAPMGPFRTAGPTLRDKGVARGMEKLQAAGAPLFEPRPRTLRETQEEAKTEANLAQTGALTEDIRERRAARLAARAEVPYTRAKERLASDIDEFGKLTTAISQGETTMDRLMKLYSDPMTPKEDKPFLKQRMTEQEEGQVLLRKRRQELLGRIDVSKVLVAHFAQLEGKVGLPAALNSVGESVKQGEIPGPDAFEYLAEYANSIRKDRPQDAALVDQAAKNISEVTGESLPPAESDLIATALRGAVGTVQRGLRPAKQGTFEREKSQQGPSRAFTAPGLLSTQEVMGRMTGGEGTFIPSPQARRALTATVSTPAAQQAQDVARVIQQADPDTFQGLVEQAKANLQASPLGGRDLEFVQGAGIETSGAVEQAGVLDPFNLVVDYLSGGAGSKIARALPFGARAVVGEARKLLQAAKPTGKLGPPPRRLLPEEATPMEGAFEMPPSSARDFARDVIGGETPIPAAPRPVTEAERLAATGRDLGLFPGGPGGRMMRGRLVPPRKQLPAETPAPEPPAARPAPPDIIMNPFAAPPRGRIGGTPRAKRAEPPIVLRSTPRRAPDETPPLARPHLEIETNVPRGTLTPETPIPETPKTAVPKAPSAPSKPIAPRLALGEAGGKAPAISRTNLRAEMTKILKIKEKQGNLLSPAKADAFDASLDDFEMFLESGDLEAAADMLKTMRKIVGGKAKTKTPPAQGSLEY